MPGLPPEALDPPAPSVVDAIAPVLVALELPEVLAPPVELLAVVVVVAVLTLVVLAPPVLEAVLSLTLLLAAFAVVTAAVSLLVVPASPVELSLPEGEPSPSDEPSPQAQGILQTSQA